MTLRGPPNHTNDGLSERRERRQERVSVGEEKGSLRLIICYCRTGGKKGKMKQSILPKTRHRKREKDKKGKGIGYNNYNKIIPE